MGNIDRNKNYPSIGKIWVFYRPQIANKCLRSQGKLGHRRHTENWREAKEGVAYESRKFIENGAGRLIAGGRRAGRGKAERGKKDERNVSPTDRVWGGGGKDTAFSRGILDRPAA